MNRFRNPSPKKTDMAKRIKSHKVRIKSKSGVSINVGRNRKSRGIKQKG